MPFSSLSLTHTHPNPPHPPPPTQLTVESIAFMLSKRLAVKIKGAEAAKAIEKKYCTPTHEEAKGRVSFPEGPTLRGEYCAW